VDKYDTLEYSWVKTITISVHLWNFLCALTITNNRLAVGAARVEGDLLDSLDGFKGAGGVLGVGY
jgi:hypothetical protein